VKPVLRVGIDFHQYSSTQTGSSSIFSAGNSDNLTHIIDTEEGYLGDYMEPAVGLSLNFDFSSDPQIQSELGIDYDLFFRLYSNNNLPKTVERKVTKVIAVNPAAPTKDEEIIDRETEITDMRMSIVPAFRFSAPLGDRLTVGLNLGVKIDLKTYQTTTVETKTREIPIDPLSTVENMKQLTVLPKLGLGLSFKLIPNRFAINVGVGINVLKYEKTETVGDDKTTAPIETDTTTVNSTLTMPSTNLGAGLSFQFNESLAGDVLVITSGLGAAVQEPAQFNLLLTMKY
jgi:hypothetical protein